MTQADPQPDVAAVLEVQEPVHGAVDLPKGRSMQPDESMEISCARPTRLILVAGAAKSGKTTLLASVYERFIRGPWAGYLFAGCATLLGFERLCHLGRAASGRRSPDTDRTKRSQGRQLLHLRVRVESLREPAQDLLLSDISGEEFDAARSSAEEARELTIVRAAHHLLLLVDGGKIANLRERQEARDEATLLMRTFVEEGLVGLCSRVDVLFTKWDIAGAEVAKREAEPFADDIWQELDALYRPRLGMLRSFRVTARDPRGQLPPAHGLEAAFPLWVKQDNHSPAFPTKPLAEPPNAVEYDRFLRRQIPGLFGEAKS